MKPTSEGAPNLRPRSTSEGAPNLRPRSASDGAPNPRQGSASDGAPSRESSFYSADELAALGLARCGVDVRISRHCRIYSAAAISIGDHTRIDDFCILSGRITLGSYVHVAAYVGLFGGGGIVLEDYVGISARTLVYSVSDDFSGEHLAGPTLPEDQRAVTSAPVLFRRFAIVGAGSVILPGVTVHEGAAIGAMSLVRADAPAWKVSVGVPAKAIKDRARAMVGRAAEVEAGPSARSPSARGPSEGSTS